MIRIDGVWLAQPPDMRAGINAVLARVANVFGAAHPPKPPACLSTNAPIAWKCRCRPSTCR